MGNDCLQNHGKLYDDLMLLRRFKNIYDTADGVCGTERMQDGVISVAANIIPKTMHDMCQFYLDGNCSDATTLQLKYLNLINDLFIETNPIPVKTAMNIMGMNVGKLRLPLYKMDTKNEETLVNTLKKYNLV